LRKGKGDERTKGKGKKRKGREKEEERERKRGTRKRGDFVGPEEGRRRSIVPKIFLSHFAKLFFHPLEP